MYNLKRGFVLETGNHELHIEQAVMYYSSLVNLAHITVLKEIEFNLRIKHCAFSKSLFLQCAGIY